MKLKAFNGSLCQKSKELKENKICYHTHRYLPVILNNSLIEESDAKQEQ